MWIREFDWLYYRLLSADSQSYASVHIVHHVWTWCNIITDMSNTPTSTRVVNKQKRLDSAGNLVANLTGSGNPQLKCLPEVKLMNVGTTKLLTTPPSRHDSFQHVSTRLTTRCVQWAKAEKSANRVDSTRFVTTRLAKRRLDLLEV